MRLEPGIYFNFDGPDGDDHMKQYYLSEDFYEQADDYLKAAWCVISGDDIDISKNLFEQQGDFKKVEAILQQTIDVTTKWFDAMVAEVFGEEYKNGW